MTYALSHSTVGAPDDSHDETAISVRLNIWIGGMIVLAHLYVLFLLPVFLLPLSPWYGLTVFPFFLMHSTQWGLIHDAIHKTLHPNPRWNEYAGRLLAVLLGVSFHVLRFGHLMHHKLNRDWQSEYVERKGPREVLDYYFTLLGGLYLTELLSSALMAILPKDWFLAYARRTVLVGHHDVYQAGVRFFYERRNINPLRFDMALVAILYTATFLLYGPAYPILIGFLFSRALMISFMDNLYHYGTEQQMSGKNLVLSPRLSRLLLHGNYHETHHRNPLVPWHQLPCVAATQHPQFDGSFLVHALMQFRGPIEKPSFSGQESFA
jgi:fatty acid desaturase